jgi:chemotaxis protein methyltransferase CheR
MEETGHGAFREWFMFMRFQASQEEYQQIVNLMTVNETYFFREEYQLKCMVGPVLAELARRARGSTLRILSMPCSTGEEPYSIALYLLEFWPLLAGVDVQIYGGDIDTNALESSRAGVFGARSVQYLPRAVLTRHFEPMPDDRFRISEDVRGAVEFLHLNLNDPLEARRLRDFDLIFCRNLLIYFDDASRRQAAGVFYDALKPGGFIFLGHSESMSRMSSLFKIRKFDDAIAYQKPLT